MAIHYPDILDQRTAARTFSFDQKDVMLYALGIGFAADPMNTEELKFTYERDLKVVPTAASTREEWDRVIGVNLRGVWSCLKYELRQMEVQGSGAIVNCASVGALTGNPGIPSYIASKHGVIGLTRTAALEYVKKGIRVNAVNPGLIDTQIARDVVSGDQTAYEAIAEKVPMGRAGKPEEIAAAVLWLCSPGASYIVGEALTIDGGMTVG